MLRFTRSHRAIIFSCLVLLVIPFIAMGWTIGRYGPGLDDWAVMNRSLHGNYASWDLPRPLMTYSHVFIFLLANGNVAGMQGLLILLEGISAVLFFELTRRIFKHWLGRGEVFPALLVSLVYVLYPSYAARLGLIWIQDSTTRILTLALALVWVVASKKDRPLAILGGAILAVITLLHKDSPTLVLLLLPAIAFYYHRSVGRGAWRNVTLAWYLVLGAYLYWHLFWPIGAIGYVQNRTAHLEYLTHAVSWFLDGLNTMTLFAYQTAYGTDLAAAQLRGMTWLLPGALALALLIVIAGGWVSRRESLAEPERVSGRRWLSILLFGIAVVIAGLLPYEIAYPQSLTIDNVMSRYTTVAMLGASLSLGMILLLPMVAQRMFPARSPADNGATLATGRSWWRRHAGPAASGVLAAVLLTGGMIRQIRMSQAYVDAWTIQRAYWHRIADLGLTLHPGMLIVMDGFTKNLDGAPLATTDGGYTSAFQAIFADMPMQLDAMNQGEVKHWKVSGDTITVTWYKRTLVSSLSDVLVLYYDPQTGAVETEPHLPYRWSSEPVYTYTGENPSPSVTPLGPWADNLIGPRVEPSICQTHVRVTSSDLAPSAGVAEVAIYPQNTIVDRRPIVKGTALNYSLVAGCGLWLRVYFTPGNGSSVVRLISQYGQDEEYGTATSDPSLSYATAFGSRVPAELPH